MKKTHILLIYLILLLSNYVYGITLNVVASDINWTASGPLNYSPFDTTTYRQQYFFDVEFSTDENTSMVIGVSTGTYTKYDRRAYQGLEYITYTFHIDDILATDLKDYPDFKKINEYIPCNVSKNDPSPIQKNFYIEVPTTQFTPAGIYTDTVDINIYQGTNKAIEMLLYTKTINVYITVGASMQMAINDQEFGDSTPYVMDMGSITEGQILNFSIKARSTSGFEVRAQSANQGGLKHIDSAITYKLPYTYIFNAKTEDLSIGEVQLFNKNVGTKITGLTYDGSISIPDISLAPAGEYSDTITYTIAEF